MTTPAVNINALKKVSTYSFYIRPGPVVHPPMPGPAAAIGRLSRKRGPSVTSPMTLGHFRFPTYWRHEGGYSTRMLDSDHDFGQSLGPNNDSFTCHRGAGGGANIVSERTIATFPISLESAAINGLLAKLKGQKVNLSQAFAERQQTVDLVSSIASDVVRAISGFKRQVGAKAWNFIRKRIKRERADPNRPPLSRYVTNLTQSAPSSRRKYRKRRLADGLDEERITRDWLAFQYGLMPALSDAYGAMEALNEMERSDSHFYRSHLDIKKGQKIVTEDTTLYGFAELGDYCRPITRTETFHGCSAELSFDIVNDLTANLASLGITNPVLLAWELLPFSFVWDWFQPVGDYLGVLDATLGYKFLAGSVSKVQRLESRVMGAKSVTKLPPTFVARIHRLERGYTRLFKFERQLMTNFPGPRIPEFKNPITLGHFANAMALLVALLK